MTQHISTLMDGELDTHASEQAMQDEIPDGHESGQGREIESKHTVTHRCRTPNIQRRAGAPQELASEASHLAKLVLVRWSRPTSSTRLSIARRHPP